MEEKITAPINKLPLVSVIVPNYNYATYLEQRLYSILNQTYKDFEIILLDDASTDNSIEILNRFRDSEKVTCLSVNPTNSGSPFLQWQKGIEMARGKYIWIAESDDFSDLSFLSVTVRLLDRHEDASVCFTSSYFVDENGAEIVDEWAVKHLPDFIDDYKIFDGKDYIIHNLYWANYVYNASAVLFRKKYAQNIDFSKCISMHYSGDWLFWIQMAYQGKIIEVSEKLNYFRRHKSSATSRGESLGKSIIENMNVIRFVESTIPQIGLYKRLVRHGEFYKQIMRMEVSDDIKKGCFNEYSELFGDGNFAHFTERFNKLILPICPFALAPGKDRLLV